MASRSDGAVPWHGRKFGRAATPATFSRLGVVAYRKQSARERGGGSALYLRHNSGWGSQSGVISNLALHSLLDDCNQEEQIAALTSSWRRGLEPEPQGISAKTWPSSPQQESSLVPWTCPRCFDWPLLPVSFPQYHRLSKSYLTPPTFV